MRTCCLVTATLLAVFFHCSTLQAATFDVTNLNDAGAGSLRQAVIDANANPGPDNVTFSVTGTITLTSGQIDITDNLTITGPGESVLEINGNDNSRIFSTASGTAVEITGLTMADGNVDGDGGGILCLGDLTLENCTIEDCNATGFQRYGGAVAVDPDGVGSTDTVTFTNCTFLRNAANLFGGGVSISQATATISGCRFENNDVGSEAGGGLGLTASTVTIQESTFTGNSAENGGGININETSTVIITKCTLYDNTATQFGGAVASAASVKIMLSTFQGNNAGYGDGLALYSPGTLDISFSISFSTITDNNEEGIVLLGGSQLRLKNSIVAGHTSSNIDSTTYVGGGTYTDLGGNYVGDSPMLDPLADNGGPTLTRLPQNASPVIDAAADCTDADGAGVIEDQRGVSRLQGDACDAGAVEVRQHPLDNPIPTLSEWGVMLLAALLGGVILWQRRRQPGSF